MKSHCRRSTESNLCGSSSVGWRLAQFKLAWLLFIMWNWNSIRDYWVINDFSKSKDLTFFSTNIIEHTICHSPLSFHHLKCSLAVSMWYQWYEAKITANRLVSLADGLHFPAFQSSPRRNVCKWWRLNGTENSNGTAHEMWTSTNSKANILIDALKSAQHAAVME